MKSLKIKGMTCSHCVAAVTKALASIDGIDNVQVNLQTGEATYHELKPVDIAVIKGKILKAGFEVDSE